MEIPITQQSSTTDATPCGVGGYRALSRHDTCWLVGLVLFAALPFVQVATFDFVVLDDAAYVSESELVRRGLDPWALLDALGFHSDNWHPVVWWSLMLDYQLFGPNPAAFHLENLAWHLANVALLFIALRVLTGERWRSGLVAALFGVHPLHVESVAWVAERKDVVSGFWWMLGMLAYSHWAKAVDAERRCSNARLKNSTRRRWWIVTLVLILGLMSKQVVVTLPCVFLLLDVWPLRRGFDPHSRFVTRAQLRMLALEKLPWFALVLGSCVIAIQAQVTAREARSDWPLSLRVANATLSGVRYLQKTVWPAQLSIQYPLNPPESIVPVALAALLLLAITIAALLAARRIPAVLVGWLWYLGVLTPVSGLVQVGKQSMADRYMYLPLIGLGIAVAWAIPAPRSRWGLAVLGGMLTSVLAALAIRTYEQTGVWQNSDTLYAHALRLDPTNDSATFYFGYQALKQGRVAEALPYLRSSVEWDRKRWTARRLYAGNRNPTEYMELNRYWADLYFTIAQAETSQNQLDAAIEDLREALRLDDNLNEARFALGTALFSAGRAQAAVDEFTELLRRQPSHAAAAAARDLARQRLTNP